MGNFTTDAKRFREGSDFASFGALDVFISGPTATSVEQTAPASLPDGKSTRSFLFWDTGRRLTTKRRVRWTFTHADSWSTWSALAWYGTPGGGGTGGSIVTVDSYWVGRELITPTAIDPAASTFQNGPGAGQVAWPAGGNDHAVDTQWGPATIHALDHLRRSPSDPQLDFSSLSQLVYGGDDTGFFQETDDDITPTSGLTGIASTTAQQMTFGQNSAAELIAGYVIPPSSSFDPGIIIDVLRDPPLFRDMGDPSPLELARLGRLIDVIRNVQGERQGPGGDAFTSVMNAASTMTDAELRRAITETSASLQRGEAALSMLQSLEARQGNRRA